MVTAKDRPPMRISSGSSTASVSTLAWRLPFEILVSDAGR